MTTSTRPPTLDDTVGPYFPPGFAANDSLDLLHPHAGMVTRANGEAIRLRVRLLDINGATATGSLLEVWQANAQGLLRVPANEEALADDPFFQGYGRVFSQAGEFTIDTVMPGPMAYEGGQRAPFITLTIFTDGISRIVTQVFFEGQALNQTDPVLQSLPAELRGRLVARAQGTLDGVQTFNIDITMRGDNETPFFDDLPAEEKP